MHDDPSAHDQQIGQRIAAARQSAGLTVRALAARLGWLLATHYPVELRT